MIAIAENKYGKSRVRLVKVKRKDGWHDLREWTVEVLLQGDFDSCFIEGDNSKILPTDTMKNTVYSLARSSTAESMEDFAKELVEFLVQRNPQVSAAEISVSDKAWDHLPTGGKPHPTTFIQMRTESQRTKVKKELKKKVKKSEAGDFAVSAGFENLVLMKTSGSAFEGYIQDSLTTLQPAKDRLLGTELSANWNYSRSDLAFNSLRRKTRETLLDVFAAHQSKSVQHTLYAMGKAVLEAVAEST